MPKECKKPPPLQVHKYKRERRLNLEGELNDLVLGLHNEHPWSFICTISSLFYNTLNKTVGLARGNMMVEKWPLEVWASAPPVNQQ